MNGGRFRIIVHHHLHVETKGRSRDPFRWGWSELVGVSTAESTRFSTMANPLRLATRGLNLDARPLGGTFERIRIWILDPDYLGGAILPPLLIRTRMRSHLETWSRSDGRTGPRNFVSTLLYSILTLSCSARYIQT